MTKLLIPQLKNHSDSDNSAQEGRCGGENANINNIVDFINFGNFLFDIN